MARSVPFQLPPGRASVAAQLDRMRGYASGGKTKTPPYVAPQTGTPVAAPGDMNSYGERPEWNFFPQPAVPVSSHTTNNNNSGDNSGRNNNGFAFDSNGNRVSVPAFTSGPDWLNKWEKGRGIIDPNTGQVHYSMPNSELATALASLAGDHSGQWDPFNLKPSGDNQQQSQPHQQNNQQQNWQDQGQSWQSNQPTMARSFTDNFRSGSSPRNFADGGSAQQWYGQTDPNQGGPNANMTGQDLANRDVAVNPDLKNSIAIGAMIGGLALGGPMSLAMGAGKAMLHGGLSPFDTQSPRVSPEQTAAAAQAYNSNTGPGSVLGRSLNAYNSSITGSRAQDRAVGHGINLGNAGVTLGGYGEDPTTHELTANFSSPGSRDMSLSGGDNMGGGDQGDGGVGGNPQGGGPGSRGTGVGGSHEKDNGEFRRGGRVPMRFPSIRRFAGGGNVAGGLSPEALEMLSGDLARSQGMVHQMVPSGPVGMGGSGFAGVSGAPKNLGTTDTIAHSPDAAAAAKSYQNVPETLMGFPRRGFTKPYEDQKYSTSVPVMIRWPDGTTHVDEVKGMNRTHALARAALNWPGAYVQPVDKGLDSFSNYKSGGAVRHFAEGGHPKMPSGDIDTLNLTPQEQFLYGHHVGTLTGGDSVHNSNGSVSTILQRVIRGPDGRYYNIPSIWDGNVLSGPQAMRQAKMQGLENYPSYDTPEQADARYMKMHDYMEKDIPYRQGGAVRRFAEGGSASDFLQASSNSMDDYNATQPQTDWNKVIPQMAGMMSGMTGGPASGAASVGAATALMGGTPQDAANNVQHLLQRSGAASQPHASVRQFDPGQNQTADMLEQLARQAGIANQLRASAVDPTATMEIASSAQPYAGKPKVRKAFSTGGTSRPVQGPGDGQDDQIPAMLSNNEHVIDAGTVAMLGNGDSEAGHRRLDEMRQLIRKKAGMKNPKKIIGKQPPVAQLLARCAGGRA